MCLSDEGPCSTSTKAFRFCTGTITLTGDRCPVQAMTFSRASSVEGESEGCMVVVVVVVVLLSRGIRRCGGGGKWRHESEGGRSEIGKLWAVGLAGLLATNDMRGGSSSPLGTRGVGALW